MFAASAMLFGLQIYTGGIENVVKAWDLRRNAVIFTMTGHTDTITSMRVSPDSGGDFLLTNSMVTTNHVTRKGLTKQSNSDSLQAS